MIDLILKGGPILWLLLAVSVFALGLVFERLAFLRRTGAPDLVFLNGLANLLRQRRMDEALRECALLETPASRVVFAGLKCAGQSPSSQREAMQAAARLEVPAFERNLPALVLLVYLAPLLGLLGTVLGLCRVFLVLSASTGVTNLTDLAGGVATALMTSGIGMAIAIPTMAAHAWLVSRINRHFQAMEKVTEETLRLLEEVAPDERIIPFHSATPDAGAAPQR